LIIPLFLLGASLSYNANVSASDITDELSKGTNAAGENSKTPDKLFGQNSVVIDIVNTLLFIIGAVSVLMIIYGGIRYTTSGGNEKSITTAKNTIQYSVLGLVVAIAAYAIVNWVIAIFSTPTTTSMAMTMAQTHQTPEQANKEINTEFLTVTKSKSIAEYAINNYIKPNAIMAQNHQTDQQATVAINNEFKSATKNSSVADYAINSYIKPMFVPSKTKKKTRTMPYTNIKIVTEPEITTTTDPDPTTTTTTEPEPIVIEPEAIITVTTDPDPTTTIITEPEATTEIITETEVEADTEPATPVSSVESSDTTEGDALTAEEITAVENEVQAAKSAAAAENAGKTLTQQQIRNNLMVENAENETGKGYGEFSALGDNIGIWNSSTDNNRLGVYQHYTGCPNVAWCASFVAFIHHKTTATPGKAATTGRSLRACGVNAIFAKAGDRLKNYDTDGNPRSGDILGWHTNDLSQGHTGILIDILDNGKGKYYTVEGNGGNYPSKVKYFIRPASYWRNQANAHYVKP
jgi:hypothetical protein